MITIRKDEKTFVAVVETRRDLGLDENGRTITGARGEGSTVEKAVVSLYKEIGKLYINSLATKPT
jgi:hypothetical protein